MFLGIRLWLAPPFRFAEKPVYSVGFGKRFIDGLSLQRTNPKAIFFFLSVFPQFIDPRSNHSFQFSALVLTDSSLVVLIHCPYALFARKAKNWLTSERGGRVVSNTADATFMFFGAAVAVAKK